VREDFPDGLRADDAGDSFHLASVSRAGEGDLPRIGCVVKGGHTITPQISHTSRLPRRTRPDG
jgi:hypothetical protein